jgi:hypothetical protein
MAGRKVDRIGTLRRGILVCLLVSLSPCLLVCAGGDNAEARETSVGMTGKINQLMLPGPELEPVPLEDRKTPVVLRIVRVYPHGSAYRYDLEYQGLEPGTFDLKNYLRRKDGSSMAEVPAIPIKVSALLPPGHVLPNSLEIQPTPFLGGYRTLQIVVVIVWVMGLAAIIYFSFLRRAKRDTDSLGKPPTTLADRLRPLVEGAMAGKLTQPELASLERTLHAFWRRKLGLEQTEPAEAIMLLHAHAEAGPLLAQLEVWLHQREPQAAVDPALLLAPYRHLPANALEAKPT